MKSLEITNSSLDPINGFSSVIHVLCISRGSFNQYIVNTHNYIQHKAVLIYLNI